MQISHMACLAEGLPISLAGSAPGAGDGGNLYWLVFCLWGVNLMAVALGSLVAMRHVLRAVPRDLVEAAKIDGCGFWGVYRHVTLPSIKPALGLIGILVLAGMCDDALAPLMESGGFSPALYAFHSTARGVTIGLGIFGLALAGLMLLIPPVLAMFCQARRQ